MQGKPSHPITPTQDLAQPLIDPLTDGRRLYTSEDIQNIFDVGKSTVEQWRLRGCGPKFIRLEGSRLVRYRREDILDYIDSQVAVSSTTEADMVREVS